MRDGKELSGKPLITIDRGQFLGNVKDLYVDPDLAEVVAVFLGREGLLKRKDRVISREHVMVFGVDAVLVKHADVVAESDALVDSATWLRLDDLKGREVVTQGGTRVGQIGDVLLDEQAGIAAFVLARVFVEGPIAENRGIMRAAMLQPGSDSQPMIVDLSTAETARPGDKPE